MIVFFTFSVFEDIAKFGEEETAHCIRVLRHKTGDEIPFVDGKGNFYKGVITEISKKEFTACITSVTKIAPLPYELHLAVAQLKNHERYEWFVEKAVEIGVRSITPLITDHSEKRGFRRDRIEKIVLSSVKQSLKGFVPVINNPSVFADFINTRTSGEDIKMIGYCENVPKLSVREVLDKHKSESRISVPPVITILIGPEGDFSADEVKKALDAGYETIHLGTSRLRTETAAVMAAASVYLYFQ